MSVLDEAAPLTVVEVLWDDSMRVRLGWAALSEYRKAMEGLLCKTSGYLLSADDQQILIVQSLYEDGSMCSEGIVIPRSAIRSVKEMTA